MGTRIRVLLTPEENRTLFELRTATTVPQRIKDRAEALRLSAHGWYVEKIATYLNWTPQTVRETIHRWNTFGLGDYGKLQVGEANPSGRRLTLPIWRNAFSRSHAPTTASNLPKSWQRIAKFP